MSFLLAKGFEMMLIFFTSSSYVGLELSSSSFCVSLRDTSVFLLSSPLSFFPMLMVRPNTCVEEIRHQALLLDVVCSQAVKQACCSSARTNMIAFVFLRADFGGTTLTDEAFLNFMTFNPI